MGFMPKPSGGTAALPKTISPDPAPKQVGGGLKNVMITRIVPSHHTPIPEQRVSMDSRHPLTKQWHRRQGADGRKITPVE